MLLHVTTTSPVFDLAKKQQRGLDPTPLPPHPPANGKHRIRRRNSISKHLKFSDPITPVSAWVQPLVSRGSICRIVGVGFESLTSPIRAGRHLKFGGWGENSPIPPPHSFQKLSTYRRSCEIQSDFYLVLFEIPRESFACKLLLTLLKVWPKPF